MPAMSVMRMYMLGANRDEFRTYDDGSHQPYGRKPILGKSTVTI